MRCVTNSHVHSAAVVTTQCAMSATSRLRVDPFPMLVQRKGRGAIDQSKIIRISNSRSTVRAPPALCSEQMGEEGSSHSYCKINKVVREKLFVQCLTFEAAMKGFYTTDTDTVNATTERGRHLCSPPGIRSALLRISSVCGLQVQLMSLSFLPAPPTPPR